MIYFNRTAAAFALICTAISTVGNMGMSANVSADSSIAGTEIAQQVGKDIGEVDAGVALKKSEIDEQIREEQEREWAAKKLQHNSICENLGGVGQYWIDTVNSKLSVLPMSLIDEFKNDGWHYYCTTMNLDATFYGGKYGGVMGTTNYDEYRILVEPRTDAMETAVVHEMGHWYDWHLGTITNSSEFMDIYYNETNVFKSTFQIHSYYEQKELFAEAFWRFYTANDQLAANCPRLYAFMSRVCPSPSSD